MFSTRVIPVAPENASELDCSPSITAENVQFHKGPSAVKEAESCQSSNDASMKVNASHSADPLIVMADSVEDLCQETVAAALITEMFNVREMIENVS